MPASRRRAKVRRARITPEAVAAFRARDWIQLHRALGLKPWEASPLDVRPGDEAEAAGPGAGVYERSFPQALQLKAELEDFAKGRTR